MADRDRNRRHCNRRSLITVAITIAIAHQYRNHSSSIVQPQSKSGNRNCTSQSSIAITMRNRNRSRNRNRKLCTPLFFVCFRPWSFVVVLFSSAIFRRVGGPFWVNGFSFQRGCKLYAAIFFRLRGRQVSYKGGADTKSKSTKGWPI